MLARTRLKLKNAESSISFMQEQHARTLEDLHKEIEKLQKKNARLSFQLTMTGVKTTAGKENVIISVRGGAVLDAERKSADHPKTENTEEKLGEDLLKDFLMQLKQASLSVETASSSEITCQPQLEEELISEIAKLQSSLSKEQESCALLQYQVNDLLTRHSEEISARDDIISQLNAELDAKASIIALVTQQLCQVRVKLKQEIEARSKSTITCTCPHCFVHRKASEGRLSMLEETDRSTDAAKVTTMGKSSVMGKSLFLPSPPSATPFISPHPPPPAPGRNHIIKRRASTPIRRQSPSPRNSRTNLSLDSSKDIARQKSLQPARATKDPSILSTELQELLSLKDNNVKRVRRETYPVLPPIPAPHVENPLQGDVTSGSLVVNHGHNQPYPGNQRIPVPGASEASSINSHRRLILTKSKGLSSAPSALRLLHYGARNRQQDAGGGGASRGGPRGEEEEGEEEEEEGDEGEELAVAPDGTLLLVKENDPRSMVPPQCAGAEGLGTLD